MMNPLPAPWRGGSKSRATVGVVDVRRGGDALQVARLARLRHRVDIHDRGVDPFGDVGEVHDRGPTTAPRAAPARRGCDAARRARHHRRRRELAGDDHADEERDDGGERDGNKRESLRHDQLSVHQ